MRPFLLFVLLLPLSVIAQDFAEAPPPPPIPPVVEEGPAGEALQPEVTIVPRQGDTIEEYRVNGRLYMIKVTPKKGYPYYLIDSDGDGRLETRRNELDDPVIPQWILFRW